MTFATGSHTRSRFCVIVARRCVVDFIRYVQRHLCLAVVVGGGVGDRARYLVAELQVVDGDAR